MRRQLSTVLGRLAAGKRENGQNGRKLHLGRTLLLGIGGATAGGLLWQYHQTGDILLKVRSQPSLETNLVIRWQLDSEI